MSKKKFLVQNPFIQPTIRFQNFSFSLPLGRRRSDEGEAKKKSGDLMLFFCPLTKIHPSIAVAQKKGPLFFGTWP